MLVTKLFFSLLGIWYNLFVRQFVWCEHTVTSCTQDLKQHIDETIHDKQLVYTMVATRVTILKMALISQNQAYKLLKNPISRQSHQQQNCQYGKYSSTYATRPMFLNKFRIRYVVSECVLLVLFNTKILYAVYSNMTWFIEKLQFEIQVKVTQVLTYSEYLRFGRNARA